jgi:uncharacterized protein (TIGR03083 family)
MTLPYVDYLESAAAEFAAVIEQADPATRVPSCPGWTIADLVDHLAGIHRWALSKATGEPETDADAGMTTSASFRLGAARLVAALRELPADQPCWTLYPPENVATWARRQALETTIHLWDAAASMGSTVSIDPELAADGVAEVVEDLYPRQVRLGRQTPLDATVEFAPTDAARHVRLTGASMSAGVARDARDAESSSAAATVTGAAADILLLLWGREDPESADIAITGDLDAVRTTLAASLTP